MTASQDDIMSCHAMVYFIQGEKWNEQNYPYWSNEAMYSTHLVAALTLEDMRGNDKRRIVERQLVERRDGRVMWDEGKVVWKAGKWIDLNYDPRAKDPDFQEYLRLKEIFE